MNNIITAFDAKNISQEAQKNNLEKAYKQIKICAEQGGVETSLSGMYLNLEDTATLIQNGFAVSEHTDPFMGVKFLKVSWK